MTYLVFNSVWYVIIEVATWPRFCTFVNHFSNPFSFSFMDTQKEHFGGGGNEFSLQTYFHPGEDSLTDFAHQHLATDVKNKRTFSNQPGHPSALSPVAPFGFCSTGMRLPTSRPSSTAYSEIHSQVESFHQLGLPTLSSSLWVWLQCSQCYTWNRQRHSSPFKMYSLHQPILSTFHVLGTNVGRLLHPWGEWMLFICIPCLAEHLAWKETQKGFYWQNNDLHH